jgi:hypothetical protein
MVLGSYQRLRRQGELVMRSSETLVSTYKEPQDVTSQITIDIFTAVKTTNLGHHKMPVEATRSGFTVPCPPMALVRFAYIL